MPLSDEHIQAGKNQFRGVTVVTPITRNETQIDPLVYWNLPRLTLFRPLVRLITRFASVRLRDGLRHQERPMFVREPDAQAKWYFLLEESYMQAIAEQRPFINPLTEQTLRCKLEAFR